MTVDTQRKFQGVWIPAERWLDRTLSPTEKVMLGEIASLDTGPRGCYATNAHFAEFFNLSISRVSEIISGLVDKGHVRIELIREGKRVV
ncbi:helix-turn-helix domain-containing protein, partial [Pseudomonas sp. GW247-3R2A]